MRLWNILISSISQTSICCCCYQTCCWVLWRNQKDAIRAKSRHLTSTFATSHFIQHSTSQLAPLQSVNTFLWITWFSPEFWCLCRLKTWEMETQPVRSPAHWLCVEWSDLGSMLFFPAFDGQLNGQLVKTAEENVPRAKGQRDGLLTRCPCLSHTHIVKLSVESFLLAIPRCRWTVTARWGGSTS